MNGNVNQGATRNMIMKMVMAVLIWMYIYNYIYENGDPGSRESTLCTVLSNALKGVAMAVMTNPCGCGGGKVIGRQGWGKANRASTFICSYPFFCAGKRIKLRWYLVD